MLRTSMIVMAATLGLVDVSAAGQCTEAIAALERSVSALQQAKANPSATPSSPTSTTGQQSVAEQSTRTVQKAKELHREGKEIECMEVLKQAKGWPLQSD